nr:E3 ubiquitin protein ligase DRIP2 [Ipomoea batatas]GME10453.1 E3 ubiquitin protein ligase DRIP2 [Ipomoea batatas]
MPIDAMEEDIEKETEVQSLWCELVPKKDKTGFQFPHVTNDKTILSVRGGRITVSKIQNYIKEKLKLNDYTEVDILCHGKKLESEFTLKMIQFIWMSGCPEYDVRAPVKNVEDLVVELGYVRNEKFITSESSG